jgi:hypothetical protein
MASKLGSQGCRVHAVLVNSQRIEDELQLSLHNPVIN